MSEFPSFHVIGESHNIQNFDGLDQIFIGNGAGLRICGVGVSSCVSPYDSHVII